MAERCYRAYGLVIRSETELPEFLATSATEHDLAIRFADEAMHAWEASEATERDGGLFVDAPGGGFAMRVPGVCDYLVRAGREILVWPASGADPVSVRLFLLGSALGMALHQRGLLVLHGATMLHEQGVTIFVGESGRGKSTLAAHLARAGFAIFGDDIMPLWPRPGGRFAVWPGSRMFKLWSDTIGALGQSAAGLDSVGERLDKYFFPSEAQAPDRPATVCEIVELVSGDAESAPSLEPLGPLEALGVINANTYRPYYVPQLGREADHFRLCAALAGGVAVLRLSRPWAMERVEESLELIQERWSRPGRLMGTAL